MATDYVYTWVKDPDAVLDYMLDFTDWLAGDTIATATVTADAGLTLASSSYTTTGVIAWLSGGTVEEYYGVRFRVVTAGGRTEDRSVQFHLKQR